MNKVDFTKEGGFPLEQNTLDFMQSNYTDAIKAVASVIGNKAILSGCVSSTNEVSPGWVYLNGEVLPFVGGVKVSENVIIEELSESVVFEDLQNKPVYIKRQVKFSSSGYIPWDSFEPVPTLFKLQEDIVQHAKTITTLQNAFYGKILAGQIPIKFPKGSDYGFGEIELKDINPLDYVGVISATAPNAASALLWMQWLTRYIYVPTATHVVFSVLKSSTAYPSNQSQDQTLTFDYLLVKKQ